MQLRHLSFVVPLRGALSGAGIADAAVWARPEPGSLARLIQRAPDSAKLAGYAGVHAAAAEGGIARLNALAAAGADLDARDSHGRTPLMVAVFRQRHDVIKVLFERGANP